MRSGLEKALRGTGMGLLLADRACSCVEHSASQSEASLLPSETAPCSTLRVKATRLSYRVSTASMTPRWFSTAACFFAMIESFWSDSLDR